MPPVYDIDLAFDERHLRAAARAADVKPGSHGGDVGRAGANNEGAGRIALHIEEGLAARQLYSTATAGEPDGDARLGVQGNL